MQYFLNYEDWRREESEQLTYIVPSPFPATQVICEVVAALKQAGWRPLQRISNDVRTESSYTQGWRVSFDNRGRPDEARIDMWDSPWTNRRGDHLSFSVGYRYPAAGPRDVNRMRVGFLRTPAHLVKMFRIYVGERIAESETPHISPTDVANCQGSQTR